ncbi:MAG: hypothetical protein DLM67_21865 [Candidatus Nephthysia bennettiae]|uniref:DoxX family membrane protein n=1 Tax=Candidatus Nephthysia bennettiae TaxID=3127016 RepID=A0A934KBR5_9BACT|nr:DoxX family membrane protein [Candidatus Dormibacteraeota bacterium]PZR87588.1 MAG: hypothetical protein DLM67_21865 [Candidatus Dormibacteraeota bacterium]
MEVLITSSVGMGVLIAIRLCLALFFLTAGIGKLANQRDFLQGTVNYDILPLNASRVLGRLLPWIELAVGLDLLLGIALPIAGLLAATLITAFIAAVVINLKRGRQIQCSGYGIGVAPTISWGTVARNATLMVMALAVAGLGLLTQQDGWLAPWSTYRSLLSSISLTILVAS